MLSEESKNKVENGSAYGFNTGMTVLLERAIHRVLDMPARRQNAIARFLLAEMDAEEQWDASFSASQNELANLAGDAIEEHRRGRTRKMDPSHAF